MQNTFSWTRVGHLLAYDWASLRSQAIYGVLAIVAISLGWVTFSMFSMLALEQNVGYALYTLGTIHNLASLAMIFWLTSLLHRKFTDARSALVYQTLPASSWEKALTMLINYLVASVALYLLFVLLYYVASGIALLIDAQSQIADNPFVQVLVNPNYIIEKFNETTNSGVNVSYDNTLSITSGETAVALSSEDFMHELFRFITRPDIYYLSLLDGPLELLIYIVLNMCFRSHAQVKSVLIMIGALVVLGVTAGVVAIGQLSDVINTNEVSDEVSQWMYGELLQVVKIIGYSLYAIPFLMAGFVYLFYRQVKCRQVKG